MDGESDWMDDEQLLLILLKCFDTAGAVPIIYRMLRKLIISLRRLCGYASFVLSFSKIYRKSPKCLYKLFLWFNSRSLVVPIFKCNNSIRNANYYVTKPGPFFKRRKSLPKHCKRVFKQGSQRTTQCHTAIQKNLPCSRLRIFSANGKRASELTLNREKALLTGPPVEDGAGYEPVSCCC